MFSSPFCLHRVATLTGMAAFRLSKSRPTYAEPSTARTIYCYSQIIVALIFAIPTIEIQIIDTFKKDDKFINTFVFLLLIILSGLDMAILGFFQPIRRFDYIRLINKSFDLGRMIADQIPPRSTFFGLTCQRLFNIRISVALLQSAVIVVPLTISVNKRGNDGRILLFSYVMFTHTIRAVFGVAFYGGMLVILQFYRDVNVRIERLIDEMMDVQVNVAISVYGRMQRYCDLSDSLDLVAKLHEQVTGLLNEIMRFFGVVLLVELINSFVNVLYGVSKKVTKQNGHHY